MDTCVFTWCPAPKKIWQTNKQNKQTKRAESGGAIIIFGFAFFFFFSICASFKLRNETKGAPLISVWAKAVNYATLLQTPPCSFFHIFVRLVCFFRGVQRRLTAADERVRCLFFSSSLPVCTEQRNKKKKKNCLQHRAASWSAWIYASRLDIPVTASTPPPPYGGDGPTDDYSGVRLTHKNAIWQKPASFTDEAPPPDAQWLMTAFLKVGGGEDPLWGAESCRGRSKTT